jgi:hypothetical protein
MCNKRNKWLCCYSQALLKHIHCSPKEMIQIVCFCGIAATHILGLTLGRASQAWLKHFQGCPVKKSRIFDQFLKSA